MHLLVAAFLGLEPKSRPKGAGSDQVTEIVAAGFPMTALSVHDGFESAAVLDFAQLQAQAKTRRKAG